MSSIADPRLIVALDLPTTKAASALCVSLGDAVSFYKIGLQLLAQTGMDLAMRLKAEGHQIFLDWKLHDIGTTVQRATEALATLDCDFVTVHGEPQVMAAAVAGRGSSPLKILAVTVLTSLNDRDLAEMGYALDAKHLVERRVRQAVDAGCDGVVCSPEEAALARRLGGPEFLIVTPGVRPAGAHLDDQARTATPDAALRSGASHVVCGRPITAAADPRAAALEIARSLSAIPQIMRSR